VLRLHILAGRRAASIARRAGLAWALAGMLLMAGTAGQALAATGEPAARAGTGSLSGPAPIPLNKLNWSGSAGFNSRGPAWYIDGSAVVHLQGAVSQVSNTGNGADLIGTLPKAARPAFTVSTIAHTFQGTYADLSIEPDGQILVLTPDFPAVTDLGFLSLEGISYRPAQLGRRIALNTVNWSGNISSWRRPGWFIDRSGVVHLQGAAGRMNDSGPGVNLIGTLPRAARPARTVYTIVDGLDGLYADLSIGSDGQIAIITARPPATSDYGVISLESITYRPSLGGSLVGLNTQNWSGNAGFNSRRPAWYADRSGIIHLQGAVRQTSSTGPGANLIATLPKAARPGRTVYAIVHTFNGTYADLAIQPSGDIDLIDARAPLVSDYTFVSLESVSYRR
jgi:hypothetical protein